MKTIQYAIDKETGLTWSRVDSEVAVPVLDYEGMDLDKSFDTEYKLERMKVLDIAHYMHDLTWTKKLPISIKNYHREFWGMKPLKETK
jgi:hypothetical protein